MPFLQGRAPIQKQLSIYVYILAFIINSFQVAEYDIELSQSNTVIDRFEAFETNPEAIFAHQTKVLVFVDDFFKSANVYSNRQSLVLTTKPIFFTAGRPSTHGTKILLSLFPFSLLMLQQPLLERTLQESH